VEGTTKAWSTSDLDSIENKHIRKQAAEIEALKAQVIELEAEVSNLKDMLAESKKPPRGKTVKDEKHSKKSGTKRSAPAQTSAKSNQKNVKSAISDPMIITFDYEAVSIKAACDVSACVSVESDNGDGSAEIGSGVCVAPGGLILTAAHVAPATGCHRIVAFADGVTFDGECVAVDDHWDLALLQLRQKQTEAQRKKKSKGRLKALKFPFVSLGATPPSPKDQLVCVGQPGRPRGERLEVVTGKVVRVVDDPLCEQNNVDTDGGLQHSCPVFAGNSGSALLLAGSGELIGIHTGYNPQRYAYCGTTLEALRTFLDLHVGSAATAK
jgi:S1-C subfamily serine protease